MAFTQCLTSTLAANVAQDCTNPRVKGYENIALIFNRNDIDFSQTELAANHPDTWHYLNIILKTSKTPFVIYNPQTNPSSFDGTSTTWNADTESYDKVLGFIYKGIGGEVSENVVEPLARGEYVVILARKDHRGDGSFPILGIQAGLEITTQVQDETTGYWAITMTESDVPNAELVLFDTDYATTKTTFDALVAQAPA